MRSLFCLAVTFVSLGCYAQTIPLTEFSSIKISKFGKKEWVDLRPNSNQSYVVSVSNNNLLIYNSEPVQSIKQFTYTHGKLFAIDAGEWGNGGLYYRPNDSLKIDFYVNGYQKSIFKFQNDLKRTFGNDTLVNKLMAGKQLQIAAENTVLITPYTYGWLVGQGLHHGTTNEGSLSSLTLKNDSINFQKLYHLDACPAASTLSEDRIYVVTSYSIYVLKNMKQELVFNHIFPEGLMPNSIAVLNEKTIFIGLRGGYAAVDLRTKKVKIYRLKV